MLKSMETIEFEIKNLECAGCAAGVQLVTEDLDGVISVKVDLEGRRGMWEIDRNKISPEEIKSEIEKLGYKTKEFQS